MYVILEKISDLASSLNVRYTIDVDSMKLVYRPN